VSAIETIISKGGKVVETDVLRLIEQLMNQLIKLDGIVADGDVKLQRKMQVRFSKLLSFVPLYFQKLLCIRFSQFDFRSEDQF
jgi:hypothetical protein